MRSSAARVIASAETRPAASSCASAGASRWSTTSPSGGGSRVQRSAAIIAASTPIERELRIQGSIALTGVRLFLTVSIILTERGPYDYEQADQQSANDNSATRSCRLASQGRR